MSGREHPKSEAFLVYGFIALVWFLALRSIYADASDWPVYYYEDTEYYSEVQRSELRFIAGSWSQHVDTGYYKDDGKRTAYNETHRSLGVTYRYDSRFTESSYLRTTHNAFTFRNSYDKQAVSYLYGRSRCKGEGWLAGCLGVAGGLSTGYQEQFWWLTPVGGFTATFDVGDLGVNTMFIPFANVMTLQLDYKFMTTY